MFSHNQVSWYLVVSCMQLIVQVWSTMWWFGRCTIYPWESRLPGLETVQLLSLSFGWVTLCWKPFLLLISVPLYLGAVSLVLVYWHLFFLPYHSEEWVCIRIQGSVWYSIWRLCFTLPDVSIGFVNSSIAGGVTYTKMSMCATLICSGFSEPGLIESSSQCFICLLRDWFALSVDDWLLWLIIFPCWVLDCDI